MKKTLLLSAIILFFTVQPALAYIDPGTGSVILQAVVGLIFAGAVTIKMYWAKILNFFKRDKTSK